VTRPVLLFYFLFGFLVSFCLVVGLVLPLVHRDNFQDLIDEMGSNKNLVIEESGEQPPASDVEAYIYHYAPSNSFGSGDIKTVNWSYFWSLFKTHSAWQLEAWHPVQEQWVDSYNGENLNNWLDIDKTRSFDNSSEKINLTVTNNAPVPARFRFKFGIDARVKQYVNKSSNYEYVLTYPANETEDYTVFFNWSDIKPLVQNGMLSVSHGVKNIGDGDVFWFIITANQNLSVGNSYTIDPVFGGESWGSTNAIYYWGSERLHGYSATPSASGVVDNMTTYLLKDGTPPTLQFHCALYEYVDHSSTYAGELLGDTEKISVSSNGYYTFEFNEPKPEITADTKYYLVVKPYTNSGNSKTWLLQGLSSGGEGIYWSSGASGNFDNPLGGETSTTWRYYLYASYTPIGGNVAPTMSNHKIWGSDTSTEKSLNATYVQLNPTCFNVTVNDTDADNMNVTIRTNASGSWSDVNTTASGITNSTYTGHNTSWIDSYAKKYWVSFNVSDDEDWTNETYWFVTTPYNNNSDYWNDSFENSVNYVLEENNIDFDINGYANFSYVAPVTTYENFGETGDMGSTYNINDAMVANENTPTMDGQANFISVRLTGWDNGEKVKCALYWDSNDTFIASTEERTTGGGDGSWFDFDFDTPPNVKSGVDYLIVVWADSVVSCYYSSSGGVYLHLHGEAYDGSFPATFSKDASYSGYRASIYCNISGTTVGTTSANITSVNITKEDGTTWNTLNVHINNTDNSTFNILDENGTTQLSGLTGNGDDISSVTNATIQIFGEFNATLSMSSWNVTWTEAGEELTWNTVTSTINGSYSNSTSWMSVISTINGSYSNITSWYTVIDTINGSYSNTTSWNNVISTINGSYSNITSWLSVISTINGSYSNTTSWSSVISTINGSYSNISVIDWNNVITTINGTYSNATSWQTVIDTVNGSYSNSTSWKMIDDTINGTYSSDTTWNVVIDTVNGSYSNSTTWNSIISTINGSYSNTTSWSSVIDTINGSYSNITRWLIVIDTVNGSYSNGTVWTDIISTINGSYSNSTSWTNIIDTINGSYSNITTWISVITTTNGTYYNNTCPFSKTLSSNPVEFSTKTDPSYNINATGQTFGTCAINITNNGDKPIDIAVKLNESIGDNIHLKYNTTFNPPGHTLDGGGDGSYNGWEEEIANNSDLDRLKIVYDSNNRPHIAGQNGLYAYRADNGTWRGQENTTHPDIIKISDTPDGSYGIDIDSSGIPHIVYHSGEEVLYTVWNSTASSWDKEIVDNHIAYGSYGTRQFYLDSNDRPHILYHVKIDGTYYVNYTYKDSNGVWRGQENTTHPDTIPSIGLYPSYPSMALDSNDYPHIAYADIHSPHQDVFYRYWNGGSWVLVNLSDELNIPVHSGTDTNIVIYNDLPSILIHADYAFPAPDKTEFLYYNGSSWNKEQLINSDCDHPTHIYNSTGVIFAVGGADGADFDDNDDRLIVFKKEDGIWTNETLKLANQYVHSEIGIASNGTIGFIYNFNGSSTNYYHNYTSSPISYSCDDEITTDSSTVKTNLVSGDSFCLYLWADFDNVGSSVDIDRLLNITVSPSSGYSGSANYSDVDLNFVYSELIWNTVIDTVNGSYSNTTSWVSVISTINGSYSNSTSWQNVISTINGSYSSDTIWTTVIDTVNGSYSNSTTWTNVITTINGSYSNSTSWIMVIDNINGSYSSITSWNVVDDTINGSWSSITSWVSIIDTVNGSYSNSTSWKMIDDTINGTYSSVTTWNTVIDTVNGSYSNSTTWTNVITTINGSYSNSTNWMSIISTVNGSYHNITHWTSIISTINGTYSNDTITWQTIISTINGTYSNTSTNIYIKISNIHPTNNSLINHIYPSIYFTINSTNGKQMNYTLYWNTSNNINHQFAHTINITNNTVYHSFNNGSDYGIRYYWRITANDGTNYKNVTYDFRTGYGTPYITQPTSNIPWIIAALGIISLVSLIFIKKKKKYNRRY